MPSKSSTSVLTNYAGLCGGNPSDKKELLQVYGTKSERFLALAIVSSGNLIKALQRLEATS